MSVPAESKRALDIEANHEISLNGITDTGKTEEIASY
jgi:hypothetical protein